MFSDGPQEVYCLEEEQMYGAVFLPDAYLTLLKNLT